VIEGGGLDSKLLLDESAPVRHCRRRLVAPCEPIPRPKLRAVLDSVIPEGFDDEPKVHRLGSEQIPGVGAEPVLNLIDEARWANEMQWSGAVQTEPQEPVEPGEVIQMRV
jgi:hypothetical protein